MGVKKYDTNDAFFKEDTENSFYVAGFIAADGCLGQEKNRNRYRISIELASKDEEHLNKIKQAMSSNVKIFRKERRDPRFIKNQKSFSSSISINSKEIYYDLDKFGITTNKSKTYEIPDWMHSHTLKHHFMRGLVDGDGGFCIKHDNVVFYICGTYNELNIFNSILIKECDIVANKIWIKQGCYGIEYASPKNVYKIVQFLYKDATIFLDRKYDKIKHYLQT